MVNIAWTSQFVLALQCLQSRTLRVAAKVHLGIVAFVFLQAVASYFAALMPVLMDFGETQPAADQGMFSTARGGGIRQRHRRYKACSHEPSHRPGLWQPK
jgi:hypothetical protein